MALGLPISVAIGWTLATPARKPAHVGAPAGTGGLGAGVGSDGIGRAPRRAGSQPLAEVQFTSPRQPSASSVVLPPLVTAPSAAPVPTSAAPSSAPIESSPSAPPILDEPPVPTPTEITVTSSEASPPSTDPTPTASTSP